MYETQDSVPVRDWLTFGGILLALVIFIVIAVSLAQNTSSSIQVVSGQLVTGEPNSPPQSKSDNNQDQGGNNQNNNQQGGKVVTAKGSKNVNQLGFFEVFLLLLLGAAIFTVVISVLIALLVIQLTRILKQIQKRNNLPPPGE
jgi:ABC-type antimicrobial peptide transport system permease subunit